MFWHHAFVRPLNRAHETQGTFILEIRHEILHIHMGV